VAAGGDRVHVRVPELYASWNPTEADLVPWVYKLRGDLGALDPTVEFDAAAAAAHAWRVAKHERTRSRREDGRTLPRRDA